jgi:hypothetical protein
MLEKEKASVLTLAKSNVEQRKSYQEARSQSSPNLREFLGVLLLRLYAGQAEPSGCRLFDRLLRQRYAGGAA